MLSESAKRCMNLHSCVGKGWECVIEAALLTDGWMFLSRMNEEARKIFMELGSSVAKDLAFRDSWVFVGAKGVQEKSPFEQVFCPLASSDTLMKLKLILGSEGREEGRMRGSEISGLENSQRRARRPLKCSFCFVRSMSRTLRSPTSMRVGLKHLRWKAASPSELLMSIEDLEASMLPAG